MRASLLAAGAVAMERVLPSPIHAAPVTLSAQQPNLLIIHTDQQSCWTLGAYGGSIIETPNIDRIAQEGALLTNFIANSAVCTPSRGCLLTGRYPHQHGAYENNRPIKRDEITLAHILQQANYGTGYFGKWHLNGLGKPGWISRTNEPKARAMGFTSDFRYMFNRGHWKSVVERDHKPPLVSANIGEGEYTSDWLTDKTIDFLNRRRNLAFFAMISYPDPHPGYRARPPYDTMFDPADMPLPETFSEARLPDWAELRRQQMVYNLENKNREQLVRQHWAYYCGAVKLLDACVGRILTTLEENHQLDNTIIIFTTDHGDYMGEHGLQGKNALYETAYRTPMLIRWPTVIPAGLRLEHMISTVDVLPTILGLMGLPTAGSEEGHDASALLRGEEIEWQDQVFVHHSSMQLAALYTPDFLLGVANQGDSILFDRVNDPLQINNLANLPQYEGLIWHMTQRMAQHHRYIDSPANTWLQDLSKRRPIWQNPGKVPPQVTF